MKTQRLLIIIFLLAVFLVTVFLVFKNYYSPSKTTGGVVSSERSQPDVATFVKGERPEYQTSRTELYPSQIPSYSVTKHPSLKETQNVATSLGFSGTPKTTVNKLGSYLFYYQASSSLTVSSNPLYVSYSVKNPDKKIPFGARPNDAASLSFFNSLNTVGLPVETRLAGVDYYFAGASEQPPATSFVNANVATFKYQYFLDGLPLYIYNPGTPAVSVDIVPSNKISGARFFLAPQLTKNQQLLNIITYNEAVNRLNSKESVLVQLETDSTKNSFVFVDGTPKTVVVDKTDLGYYYSQDDAGLGAVFVFYGKGTKDGLELNTITVVSAVP